MNKNLALGSLFDGSGGFPLAVGIRGRAVPHPGDHQTPALYETLR